MVEVVELKPAIPKDISSPAKPKTSQRVVYKSLNVSPPPPAAVHS